MDEVEENFALDAPDEHMSEELSDEDSMSGPSPVVIHLRTPVWGNKEDCSDVSSPDGHNYQSRRFQVASQSNPWIANSRPTARQDDWSDDDVSPTTSPGPATPRPMTPEPLPISLAQHSLPLGDYRRLPGEASTSPSISKGEGDITIDQHGSSTSSYLTEEVVTEEVDCDFRPRETIGSGKYQAVEAISQQPQVIRCATKQAGGQSPR
ncbi:hypothetical protein OPQ81_005033 [Rhizoctonia solani]|nr:hypothetical protein OPQ81_005033 [Rhizoctonia solani]